MSTHAQRNRLSRAEPTTTYNQTVGYIHCGWTIVSGDGETYFAWTKDEADLIAMHCVLPVVVARAYRPVST